MRIISDPFLDVVVSWMKKIHNRFTSACLGNKPKEKYNEVWSNMERLCTSCLLEAFWGSAWFASSMLWLPQTLLNPPRALSPFCSLPFHSEHFLFSPLQEDAKVMWGSRGQTSSRTHPLRAASWKGCDWASVCIVWGENCLHRSNVVLPWIACWIVLMGVCT